MKVSLHAVHAEKDGRKVDRDEYDVSLFERWIDLGQRQKHRP